MPIVMAPAKFAEWEPKQPRRLELIDGKPMPLPQADQAASRLVFVRQVPVVLRRLVVSARQAENDHD